jgi:four helix bundle protein
VRYEDLDVWKESARLSAEIFRYFDGNKDFPFRDQIVRSGLSIPSNIAEGGEREPGRDSLRFLVIAKGSCGELRTQIYIGMSIGYISQEVGKRWLGQTRKISAMLYSLIRALRPQAGRRPAT